MSTSILWRDIRLLKLEYLRIWISIVVTEVGCDFVACVCSNKNIVMGVDLTRAQQWLFVARLPFAVEILSYFGR